MNLGEQIYNLRTQRNLSQGDLADALDVSRQSISKWENNNSVPDLDKLVKLSDLFGVSLDELVTGEKHSSVDPPEREKEPMDESVPEPKSKNSELGFPARKIIGIILLCMGFLVALTVGLFGGLGSGVMYALPFVLCGIICFLLRKRIGLWCAWVVALLMDACGRWVFGHYGSFSQMPRIVIHSILHGSGIQPWNVLSVLLPIGLLTLVIVTAVSLRKKPLLKKLCLGQRPVDLSTWHLVCVIMWWAVIVVWFAVGPIGMGNVEGLLPYWYASYLIVIDWSWLISLTSGLTFTLQYIYTYRIRPSESEESEA